MQSLTCLIKKEEDQYASLCLELDVASCGKTKEEAIEGLKNTIEAYYEYMVSTGKETEIFRPVPMNELKEFLFPEYTVTEQPLNAISLDF